MGDDDDLTMLAEQVRTFGDLEAFFVRLSQEAAKSSFSYSNSSLTDYANGLAGAIAIYMVDNSLADDSIALAADLEKGVPYEKNKDSLILRSASRSSDV